MEIQYGRHDGSFTLQCDEDFQLLINQLEVLPVNQELIMQKRYSLFDDIHENDEICFKVPGAQRVIRVRERVCAAKWENGELSEFQHRFDMPLLLVHADSSNMEIFPRSGSLLAACNDILPPQRLDGRTLLYPNQRQLLLYSGALVAATLTLHDGMPEEHALSCQGTVVHFRTYYYVPCVTFAGSTFAKPLILTPARPIHLIGHRGCGNAQLAIGPRATHNENSLSSFKAAYKATDCIETDCVVTEDGVPIINHNFTIGGLKSKLFVHKMQYPDIKQINLQSQKFKIRPKQVDTTILTLDELLQNFNDKLIDLEIKFPNFNYISNYYSRAQICQIILKVLADYQNGKIIFSSFDLDVMWLLNNIQSRFPCLMICNGLNCQAMKKITQKGNNYQFPEALSPKVAQQTCQLLNLAGIVLSKGALMKCLRQGYPLVQNAHFFGQKVFVYGIRKQQQCQIKKQQKISTDSVIVDFIDR